MHFKLIFIFSIIFLFFIGFFYYKKSNVIKISKEKLENDPKLITYSHDQHIRRLNKFRESNYKGIIYYLGPKGGLYFYSKNGVRIYL